MFTVLLPSIFISSGSNITAFRRSGELISYVLWWRSLYLCTAIAQAVSRRLPTAVDQFKPRSGHVVDKVALGQVFSKYFCFPCQFSFHRLLHTHHLPPRAGTIGQLVAGIPSGHSLTSSQEIKKNRLSVPQVISMFSHQAASYFPPPCHLTSPNYSQIPLVLPELGATCSDKKSFSLLLEM
jgi:hypothetical protein